MLLFIKRGFKMKDFLPTSKTVLSQMQRFDRTFNYTNTQFPLLCYETAVLMYIWIKINDKDNIPKLVVGQYNWKNNNRSKRNQSEGSILHIWIKYKDKIIDYSHIQFDLDRKGINASTYEELEQEYNLEQYPYEYRKNDVHYSDTIQVKPCPHLQSVISTLIKENNFCTFDELAKQYIYLIRKQHIILNNFCHKINIFNIGIQAYYWYSKFDLFYKKKFELSYADVINNYNRYLLECKKININ